MSNKIIILIVTLFVLIIAGMFVFATLKQREKQPPEPPIMAPEATSTDPYANIVHIDTKHYYIDGVHTLVGEMILPTPCDLLEASASVIESFPEQIRVGFNVINTASECESKETTQRFQVSAAASQEASFSAIFMGREVELNRIPAAAGERPEDFEVYLKG